MRVNLGSLTLALACFFGVVAPACTGNLNGNGNGPQATSGPGVAGNSASGGGTDGMAAAGQSGVGNAACASPSGIAAGPAPLVRLSAIEYTNTLRDLFPKVTISPGDLHLPAEVQSEGFLNTAEAQAPSAALIEALHDNAAAVAKLATADLSRVLSCSPASPSDEAACGSQFIASFGKQAFRRPLNEEESTRYAAFFESVRTKWGFAVAIRSLIQAFLQTPAFLYRLEYGGTAAAGSQVVPLDGHQVASRVAYLLTDTMPDAELSAAADADALASPEAIEAQARRLMQLDRARQAVASFHAQWLRFEKLDNLVKASDLFPAFGPSMASALKESTVRYVDRIFWDEGHTLRALLTDNHAFVNAALAPLYGVTAGGADLAWTPVDASQRSGILTQAGLMAGLAHERNDAPVLRGVFVLGRLLCQQPPPPLAGVNTSLPPLTAESNQTTREQLEASHNTPQCAGCHNAIDGIGFAFENYDALGQWRTQQFGKPVDSSGAFVGTDIDGSFVGAVDMGKKLAESKQVEGCLAAQWLGYALAVRRAGIDACMTAPLVKALEDSNGDLREMLVALVKSDAFRHRLLAD
ncbi:MAG TPA: DUF1592 domain-containing protein [Polyangiaceae bacterium]|nr:DUF1592 domain-containing protein [Polyangiaceae bacterium]